MHDLERAGGRVREDAFVPPTSLDVLGRRASSLRRRRHVTSGAAIGIILVLTIASAALAFGGRREYVKTVDGGIGPRGGTSAPRSETPPCLPSQLDMSFAGFGMTGSESSGVALLTNTSTVTCSLAGYPSVTMTNPSEQPLDVTTKQFNGRAPNNLEPNAVTLEPDSASKAAVMLDWINWCHADPGPITLSLAFLDWPEPITARSNGKNDLPACGPRGQPSTLFVAPVAVADDSGIHSQPSADTRDPSAPALDIPAGVVACRSSDLEFAPGAGLSLLRFFNRSGRSCGLAGYVTVFGRVATGQWRQVRTTHLDVAAVSAPAWTGVFEPSLTAVVSIRPTPTAECVATSAPTHYTALRLALPRDAGTIDIDSIQFDADDCPLQVTPFSGDSQDN